MKRIMSAMEDSENFQEVVNRLLEIKRGEDQIQSEIKRRQAEEGNTILDEDIFDDE
jgi:predicted DNA-binding protein